MKIFFSICILIASFACNMPNESEPSDEKSNTSNNVYKFRLQPQPGSTYYFEIINSSNTSIKTDDQKVDQQSRTTVGVFYKIEKDSAGNYLVGMTYDKILLHTKKGKEESDFDAANASATFSPVEKMLGILKNAKIVATVSPAGETLSVNGYAELAEKVMASMHGSDINTRNMAKSQWDQLIENGIIRKNVEQLFGFFPDSSVQVGDQWTLKHSQEGEINLDVTSDFTLKKISGGKAIITSEGELSQSKPTINMMGITVTGNLKGTQEGTYEVDTETGMLSGSTQEIKIEGAIQVMGREVPITIKNTVKMNGRKV